MERSPRSPSGYLPESRRWTIPLVGLLGSIALHALLLAPALLGFTAHKRPLPFNGASVVRGSSSEEPSMTLVLVDQPDSSEKSDRETGWMSALPLSRSALIPMALPEFPLTVGHWDSLEDDDETADEAAASSSDAGRTLMFGRYVGQIDARIQRAWIRPRTSIDAVMFACRVKIAQERSGRVLEIEIVRCNGDISWQTSLIHAIQSASPLPAPPDPNVFSRTLTLEFTAHSFTPGGSPEGFEPESRTAMK